MLEFLLKYPPELLHRGVIQLAVSWEAFTLMMVAVAVAGPWLLGYASLSRTGHGGDLWGRGVITLLRAGVLVLVVFVLLMPQLLVPMEAPSRGRVAVLIDDSLSMRVTDQAGATRASYVLDALAPGSGTLAQSLEARFETAYLKFSGHTAPLHEASELAFDGAVTNLAEALRQAHTAYGDRSASAIVVVTDGGADGGGALAEAISGLRANGISLHIVGVGSERFTRELELSEVRVPKSSLAGDTIEAEVVVSHRGLGGESVRLRVEDDSLIIAEEDITLPRDSDQATFRLELTMVDAGPHDLLFRLSQQRDEVVIDNNDERVVVDVDDERIDVLHLEGEPRFEVKFVRRAVSGDDHIRLVSLVRTSDNKLYHLGVEGADELANGFPETAEDLFPFRVVVLGSVEASHFSIDQQRLLVDYVGRRGGGLLLLGGRHAFAEGRYGESRLAALLPVALDPSANPFHTRVRVEPTRHSTRHTVLRMIGDDALRRLPELNMVNPVHRLKPGATLLLGGHDGVNPPLVVLASHRYGRGTVAALPVRDTWRWQMNSEVPLDDLSHEILWRQMLRWLARPASGRVRIALPGRQGAIGQPLELAAEVLSAEYEPLDAAEVRISIESPLGERVEQILQGNPLLEGRYETRFTPTESGRYDIEVALLEDGRASVVETAYINVSSNGREFHQAELDAALLRRLARETGGRYYPAEQSRDLVDGIAQPDGGRMVTSRLPLWDAPLLYLLIIAGLASEWFLRRRRRLR